jgi:fatty-acyl-CoA synthase
VIGVANECFGEVGKAFVVPKPNASLTAEVVTAHCRSRLAKYKAPAEVIIHRQVTP